jgi:spermidine/putrescine transport system substrate-binding protein
MKKIILGFIIVAISLILASCGNNKPKLYIYNWTYYMPQEVIQDFEKVCNCEVVYDVFSSNEEMFAKLKAGSAGYDIVFPGGDFVSVMMKEDMLEKLNHAKLPNFQGIDPEVLKRVHYDPGNQYSMPYMYAAAGIAVNKKYVKDYPHNFHIFEKNELKGKMTLLDDMREVIGSALNTLGYDVNSLDPKHLAEAKELILKWKKNIVKFDSESFSKGFASGEFWVVHGYAENIFLELDPETAKNTDFFISDLGGPSYMDNMVILKNSKNKDLAYQFINFVYEPKEFAKVTDYLGLANINIPSRQYNTKPLHYTVADMKKTEMKVDLGKNMPIYNKLWESIRVQN